jgi:uncharacterized cupin superfamily protein
MQITVRKPKGEEIGKAAHWPIWSCPPSEFDWTYDKEETCYVLSGKVTVIHSEGETHFGAGDWVVFEKGLSCRWIVESTIEKRYRFS